MRIIITKYFKNFLICWFLSSLFFTTPVQGSELEIPSSFNPVGSGARAIGIGGAFIAVADDATAASWNPGGLTQLRKPEFSMVMSGFYRGEDIEFGTDPYTNGDHSVSEKEINYLSVAYPFEFLNRYMVVSLSYQRLYDCNRNWNFTLQETAEDFSSEDHRDFQQTGSLSALGLAYSIQITPQLSAGITLNLWKDSLTDNHWKENYIRDESGTSGVNPFTNDYARTDEYSFSGINANLGILWSVNDRLSIGAVLKTPFKADIEHKMHKTWDVKYPLEPYRNQLGTLNDVWNEEMDMPLSFGIGFVCHISELLCISGDIYRTEWDDFIFKDENGEETSAISGYPIDESDISPTYQLRLGAEYLLLKDKKRGVVVPLRGGIFYDPAPAEESPDDFFGVSIGSGFIKNNYFSLDIAYQYRFGNNLGKYMAKAWQFSYDAEEHRIYMSMILYTNF